MSPSPRLVRISPFLLAWALAWALAWDVYVRFAEAFRLQHANNLAAAEERSMKLYMEGNMPAARGKKTLKPMTEVSSDQFMAVPGSGPL